MWRLMQIPQCQPHSGIASLRNVAESKYGEQRHIHVFQSRDYHRIIKNVLIFSIRIQNYDGGETPTKRPTPPSKRVNEYSRGKNGTNSLKFASYPSHQRGASETVMTCDTVITGCTFHYTVWLTGSAPARGPALPEETAWQR